MTDAAHTELEMTEQDPEGQLDADDEQAEEPADGVGQGIVEADEVAQSDGEALIDWIRIAVRITAGDTPTEAWNTEVFGPKPTDEVIAAGIADALAGITRALLVGARQPEGGQQAQQRRRTGVPKHYRPHDDRERTPANQLASLSRQAIAAHTNSEKLGNIQQSEDDASTKAMRTIVLAQTQEVEFARLERELGKVRSRAERQKYTLTIKEKAMEELQAMCSIEAESLDVTGDAALMPGRRNSTSHPFLEGNFGDFYAAVLTGQAVLTRNIENTVKYFKRRNATYCANCRRSINLEVGKIFTCKVCLATLYCGANCAVRHRAEHLPVCKVHEGWNMGAQDSAGAVGWGVTAGFAIGGEAAPAAPAEQEVIELSGGEDHDAPPSAQEGGKGGKGAKGAKGGKGGKGTKGAKGSKGSKGGKGKKRKRTPSAPQSENYLSGGGWDSGWENTKCYYCEDWGHIARECPYNRNPGWK